MSTKKALHSYQKSPMTMKHAPSTPATSATESATESATASATARSNAAHRTVRMHVYQKSPAFQSKEP